MKSEETELINLWFSEMNCHGKFKDSQILTDALSFLLNFFIKLVFWNRSFCVCGCGFKAKKEEYSCLE